MVKWLVAIGALVVALGVLLWQLAAPPRPVVAHTLDASPTPQSDAQAIAIQRTPNNPVVRNDVEPSETEPKPELLVPGGDKFNHRLDVAIPDQFRAAAAHCYDPNELKLDPNLTLKISLQLRVVQGEVSATDVSIAKSELNNQELEQCFVSAVKQGRWYHEDLPDWNEEQELFIRLRALKKYESRRQMFEEEEYE